MPADEPDLTAELDEAEALVLHDITTVAEWGYRLPETPSGEAESNYGAGGENFARSVISMRRRTGKQGTLVRRTVTYGPWETVPDRKRGGERQP